LAGASYLLVERPVRRWGSRTRPVAASGTALAGVSAALALVVLAPTADAAVRAADEPVFPRGARDGIAAVGPVPTDGAGQDARPRHRAVRHQHPVPGREPVVDVFGDSIAWTLVTYLPEHPGLDIRDRTMLGCGVARTGPYRYFGQLYPGVSRECRAWPDLWRHAIEVDDPDVVLIVVGRWETMDRQLDGRWSHVGEPEFDAYLRSQLELAIRTAGAHGARVLLATEPYNRRGEQLDGSLWPEDEPERVTAWNALLRDVATHHHRVRVVDFGERLTPDGEFTWTAGGRQVRSDGVHLTPSGVQGWVAPWLLPQLRAAARG
ncbi:MAG TPA: SGNH hydrolase domain-containing protein, partial [Nocardioides sp.]|nr:SGNH hydrolase domain-containing protein [Nocardioides sp.]